MPVCGDFSNCAQAERYAARRLGGYYDRAYIALRNRPIRRPEKGVRKHPHMPL
jgi:hypothetical protein